jgi:N-acetylglucosaminyl-diphospho-decaprenol L-rhamnosyltransferase
VVLVDNGSTDGTLEAVAAAFPEVVRLSFPDNPGYGGALNRAFRGGPAWSYLALNSDILLHADAIKLLMDFLRQHPECGLVGPALMYPDGRPQPSAKRFPDLAFGLAESLWLNRLLPGNGLVRRFYYADQDLANHPWVDTVSGAAMLIRGEAFRRIGGFDEGFRMYFEETDLCRRLHDAGYRVAFCPQATAVHWHGASTIQTSVRQVEYYLSYVRFFRKHHGRGAARILAVGVAVGTVLRMLALPFKYPPLSRRRVNLLRPKLAACACLLKALRHSARFRPSAEVLS